MHTRLKKEKSKRISQDRKEPKSEIKERYACIWVWTFAKSDERRRERKREKR